VEAGEKISRGGAAVGRLRFWIAKTRRPADAGQDSFTFFNAVRVKDFFTFSFCPGQGRATRQATSLNAVRVKDFLRFHFALSVKAIDDVIPMRASAGITLLSGIGASMSLRESRRPK